MSQQNKRAEQAMQPRCIDLPNESDDHYWQWVIAPKSVPSNYRECPICKRIDASEWHEQEIAGAKLNGALRGYACESDEQFDELLAELSQTLKEQ